MPKAAESKAVTTTSLPTLLTLWPSRPTLAVYVGEGGVILGGAAAVEEQLLLEAASVGITEKTYPSSDRNNVRLYFGPYSNAGSNTI